MIYLNPMDRFKDTGTQLDVPVVSVDKKYTVPELKAMCKEQGLTGYSKLKEAELIELLGL